MLKQIPNALTLTRLFLSPLIALLYLAGVAAAVVGIGNVDSDVLARQVAGYMTAAAVCFVIAALTDLFDGMAARAFNAHSKLGRIIDPIADKMLVGLPLLAIAFTAWQGANPAAPVIALATAVIVIRDVTMTVIRLTSPDGEGARVSSLAKIKTALELIVVGSALVVTAFVTQMQIESAYSFEQYIDLFETIWLALLVIAAALSAWTAFQYLAPKSKSRD